MDVDSRHPTDGNSLALPVLLLDSRVIPSIRIDLVANVPLEPLAQVKPLRRRMGRIALLKPLSTAGCLLRDRHARDSPAEMWLRVDHARPCAVDHRDMSRSMFTNSPLRNNAHRFRIAVEARFLLVTLTYWHTRYVVVPALDPDIEHSLIRCYSDTAHTLIAHVIV